MNHEVNNYERNALDLMLQKLIRKVFLLSHKFDSLKKILSMNEFWGEWKESLVSFKGILRRQKRW